jgi:hypothetical protein
LLMYAAKSVTALKAKSTKTPGAKSISLWLATLNINQLYKSI